jgi:hypothetical protein
LARKQKQEVRRWLRYDENLNETEEEEKPSVMRKGD